MEIEVTPKMVTWKGVAWNHGEKPRPTTFGLRARPDGSSYQSFCRFAVS